MFVIDRAVIGVDTVEVGDLVAENNTPWIKAKVTAIEYDGHRTYLTVEWLKDERHGNMIARKGAARQYGVNKYGVSDIRKVG